MKKLLMIISLVFLLCFTFSCQKQAEEAKPTVDIEAEKSAVKTLIDDWIKCIEAEDMELLSKFISHDDNMVFFGTDAAERWVGWEPLKESMQKQFDSVDNTHLKIRELVIKVHNSGEVAWVSLLWDFKGEAMGEQFSIEGARVTGVLEKRNGNWVFVQSHTSMPVTGQVVKY